jgi:hypothetical protein
VYLQMAVVINKACGNLGATVLRDYVARMRIPHLSRMNLCLGIVYRWERLIFNVPNVEKLRVRSGCDIALEFARRAVQR